MKVIKEEPESEPDSEAEPATTTNSTDSEDSVEQENKKLLETEKNRKREQKHKMLPNGTTSGTSDTGNQVPATSSAASSVDYTVGMVRQIW